MPMSNIWFEVDDADAASVKANWEANDMQHYNSNKHFKPNGSMQLYSVWTLDSVASAVTVDANATALAAWDAVTGADEGTVTQAGNLLDYMPDIVEYDENGDIISTTPATEVTDRIFLSGQAPRTFT
jgi:hypothetical protein